MNRSQLLGAATRRYGILAVYLFGSRAEDGKRVLSGEAVSVAGSDLDVGVVFVDPGFEPRSLSRLQVDLEEVFAPLNIDLVPLQHVDALFQFEAIDGERVAASDPLAADHYELVVMRRAAELLPIERQLERDSFGVSTV
jgi:predicted nucleotidyltransferase